MTTKTNAKATKATKADSKAKKADSKPANNGLTGNESKVLSVLAKAKKPLTRGDLAKATGINKGWARMMGAATKDNLGASGDESLEGRGLVDSSKEAGDRHLMYTITAKGRKALTNGSN